MHWHNRYRDYEDTLRAQTPQVEGLCRQVVIAAQLPRLRCLTFAYSDPTGFTYNLTADDLTRLCFFRIFPQTLDFLDVSTDEDIDAFLAGHELCPQLRVFRVAPTVIRREGRSRVKSKTARLETEPLAAARGVRLEWDGHGDREYGGIWDSDEDERDS
ncbi:hypothetical protein JCM11641_007255 [Rhodosporidiobolus odoratus]